MPLLLFACSAPDAGPAEATHFESTSSDPELEAALTQALLWSATTDLTVPWNGLRRVSGLGASGCPSTYDGEPPDVDVAGTGFAGPGTSWVGSCDVNTTSYRGYMYWESSFSGDLSAGAARMLAGDSSVLEGDANLYEFDGTAVDRYEESTLSDGRRIWEYEATVTATSSGSLAYEGTLTPGGVQQDLFLYYSGGDIQLFEALGNVHLFEDALAGKFDSVYLDVELQGPAGAAEGDCLLEPKGTIGLRDTDAAWYYVVFQPKYNSTLDYENEPYATCDGCGTVYYRGFEQESVVCPDFDALWSVLTPPDAAELSF